MLSLSRIAEEIILWTSEFDFVELSDEYSSSSSIMPQKKNPDVAELIRARAGRVCGNLSSAVTIYKAMPFAYNRDFQEINPLLYFSLESAEISAILTSRMLSTAKFKAEVMREKATKGFSIATDVANLLVQKAKIPFRVAHRIVGRIAMEDNLSLEKLLKAADEVAKEYREAIRQNIGEGDLIFDVERVLESRKNLGSPSKAEVKRMIEERFKILERDREELDSIVEKLCEALEKLYGEVERLVR
jgi:argininosuccinate lyase